MEFRRVLFRSVASPLTVLRSRRRLFSKLPIGVSAVSAGTKTSSFVTTSTERTQAATEGSVARIGAGRADQTKRPPLSGAATIIGGYAASFPSSRLATRSEERRVGKECVIRVDLGGRRVINKKKNAQTKANQIE